MKKGQFWASPRPAISLSTFNIEHVIVRPEDTSTIHTKHFLLPKVIPYTFVRCGSSQAGLAKLFFVRSHQTVFTLIGSSQHRRTQLHPQICRHPQAGQQPLDELCQHISFWRATTGKNCNRLRLSEMQTLAHGSLVGSVFPLLFQSRRGLYRSKSLHSPSSPFER